MWILSYLLTISPCGFIIKLLLTILLLVNFIAIDPIKLQIEYFLQKFLNSCKKTWLFSKSEGGRYNFPSEEIPPQYSGKNKNFTSTVEHEATTSKINEEQLYYCNQRGLNQEEAISLIVNGFCKEVLQQLPMEFAVEAQKLVSISLEGSVG